MHEFERLAWLIAEEFVRVVESLEAIALEELEDDAKPLVIVAKA